MIVISGPSGSGKSTLVRRLLARPDLRLRVSVSATTRQPRPGEERIVIISSYSPEQFAGMQGEMLEWAQVHGHLYGTPGRASPGGDGGTGFCVILVIDVQGGFQVSEKVPDALLVFIQPPEPRGARETGCGSGRPTTRRRSSAGWPGPPRNGNGPAITTSK